MVVSSVLKTLETTKKQKFAFQVGTK